MKRLFPRVRSEGPWHRQREQKMETKAEGFAPRVINFES